MSVAKITKSALKEINPSTKERSEVKKVQQKLLNAVPKDNVKPLFCGSIEKNTWLSGQKDIDLFLLFPEGSEEELERKGLELAKKIVSKCRGTYEIAYSEHPYIKAVISGHEIDIVPAFDIKDPSKLRSSVDRTPHHVRYVKKNSDRKIKNEIRLFKKFCKSIGVYGSDLKTEGFSGYLCELLIIKYKTFENLLRAITHWEPGTVIDMEHSQNENEIREKFQKPLIVIDPVDPNRNVASVLSAKNFFKLKDSSLKFLKNPVKDYFVEADRTPISTYELKGHLDARETRFILIQFDCPDAHEDVIWPQMRKTANRIKSILEENEFEVLRRGVWSNNKTCVILMEMLVDSLPKIQKREGPSVLDYRNSKSFLDRYSDFHTFIEDDRWNVEFYRAYRNAMDLIVDILNGDVDKLKSVGIPEKIAVQIDDDVAVITDNHVYDVIETNPEFAIYMNDYLRNNV